VNKAFTFDDGGWYYCLQQWETCPYADQEGKCTIPECVFDDWDDDDDEADGEAGSNPS
jgi:hypothetical protein